jgi:hypothetical protein
VGQLQRGAHTRARHGSVAGPGSCRFRPGPSAQDDRLAAFLDGWTRLREIAHLLTRPVGRRPKKPIVLHAGFLYCAASWQQYRRVVANVEWHAGELYPSVGFILTNIWKASAIISPCVRRSRPNARTGKVLIHVGVIDRRHFASLAMPGSVLILMARDSRLGPGDHGCCW